VLRPLRLSSDIRLSSSLLSSYEVQHTGFCDSDTATGRYWQSLRRSSTRSIGASALLLATCSCFRQMPDHNVAVDCIKDQDSWDDDIKKQTDCKKRLDNGQWKQTQPKRASRIVYSKAQERASVTHRRDLSFVLPRGLSLESLSLSCCIAVCATITG
jgi:hypothetical protein